MKMESGVQGASSPAERSGADQAAAFPLAEPGRRRRPGEDAEVRTEPRFLIGAGAFSATVAVVYWYLS
ncbi:MAG TPA: hypothetical protein VEQ37_09860, partial [Actinomycetota bacterium]|nr:hypothetical protein [Actinomycetota bacterium]